MEDLNQLMGLVRTGTVSAVKKGDRTARVTYDGSGMVSGHLKILKNPPFLPAEETPQQTGAMGGGSGEAAFATHVHPLTIRPWLPAVGDWVLCLCLPNSSGDGFILGGL